MVTLRDRTELEALIRELDGVDALTDALRAQQHEFSNRMHTLAGLIELGDHDAAAHYALDVSKASAGLAESIRAQIERPEIAAMLLAKTTIAAERSVQLDSHRGLAPDRGGDRYRHGADDRREPDRQRDRGRRAGPGPARVTVRLRADESVAIEVSDTGAGVPERGRGRDLQRRLHDEARRSPTVSAESVWRSSIGWCASPAGTIGFDCEVDGTVFTVDAAARGAALGGGRLISTLIVEDDYHVATIHGAYVRRVGGFDVAGHASTLASGRFGDRSARADTGAARHLPARRQRARPRAGDARG